MKSVKITGHFFCDSIIIVYVILCGLVAGPADAHVDQPATTMFTDVRLVGGYSANNGIVEVLTPLLGWYPVCWNFWWNSYSVQLVLCRQLGYTGIEGRSAPSNSDQSMNAYYQSLRCSGSEESLSDCSQEFRYLTTSCNEVNVTCSACQTNSVHLRGGLIPEQGNVELCINGGWTGVCGASWDYKDAFVVCRQLGLPATDVIHYTYSDFNPQYYLPGANTFYYNCFGNESQLVNCLNSSYTCPSNRIAGVYCRGETVVSQECSGNNIRLSGGRDRFEGRIEVCSNGVWGTVYGGNWDYNDAVVACRQLFGSSGQLRNFLSSSITRQLFGLGTGPIVLSNLNCVGTEGTLQQCPFSSYYFGTTHSADVGIHCQQNFAGNAASNCANGEIRLVGGSALYEGRVEMCYNRVWGSVCDTGWDNNDAAVVCQQLGYQGANATAVYNSYYGESSGLYYLLSDVRCNGHERNLTECVSINFIGYQNCLPGNEAGVRCDDSLCNHGDVRLFGGYSDRDGVAEVCINGYWGDICDNHWDSVDATVFCRQIFGENTISLYSSCCTQTRATGNVTLANLDCSSGNPNTIVDCSYDLVQGYSSSGCRINEESIAGCFEQTSCTTGDVRLMNGVTSSDGRVEMCFDNVWGTISTRYWSLQEAEVTCRQLGLSSEWSLPVTNFIYGRTGNARFERYGYYYDRISRYRGYRGFRGCRGSEQSLILCDWRPPTQFTLESSSNSYASAGVLCQAIENSSSACEVNDIRLVNGTNEMDGRVEICAYGTWVTMCDVNWGIEETQTVCKHLEYPTEGSFHIPSSPFGVDYSLPIAGHLRCTSETTKVGECQLTNRTSGCHYGRSIGVVCQERTYYNVSIKVLQGPFEIGSVIQLNCTVTLQPDTEAAPTLSYVWRYYPFTSSSTVQNLTTTIYNYYPAETTYYCHVYSGGTLLGIGRKTISVKGLLHPTVPTSIMAPNSETVALQVNTTDIEVRHYLRELAWYHNGQRLIPNEHMLLSEDNKTLTILNTTDEDSGVYEAMFEGLLVYPHNRYCERVHVNLLRYHPILSPVVFQVSSESKSSIPLNQLEDIQGISIDHVVSAVSSDVSVIPFTDGDNITLSAKGYISKILETAAERTFFFWYRDGIRSTSSLSSVERLLLFNSNYLNVSQSFSLTSGDFSDAGVYEVKLVVDMYNSFYHHTQCRPYYNTFVGTSNRFGRQYIILSQAEVHVPYVDMLSFSLEVDKPSITQEESATITCSASIKYPPLTTLSLVKAGVQLAVTADELLIFNSKDVIVNLYGVYTCNMDASGVELHREILLKGKGYLQLELDLGNSGLSCYSTSMSMTDLVQSLSSKIQDECRCNFTVEAFVNSSVTCSGNKINFETTVEFSTNDGHETASSVIDRIVSQASYSGFSLDVNGSTLMVTSVCSDCSDSFSAGAGVVGGSFVGGLLIGIIILSVIIIVFIAVVVVKKRKRVLKSTHTSHPANPKPQTAKPPAATSPTTSHTTTGTENRYASRATKAPLRPPAMKPNTAYVVQARRVKEMELEPYEDMEVSTNVYAEAIYEETM